MRALVQRVTRASVSVDGAVIGEVGTGLCVFVGATHGDDAAVAERLAEKVWNLRLFPDAEGQMGVSLAEGPQAALVISQFTLYGDTRKGRRPSWIDAARPDVAEPLVDAFAQRLVTLGAQVATGRFGADMDVELVNDGPVTLMLEIEPPPVDGPV